MMLDCRLISAPVFGSGYVESYHKGEIYWKTDPTKQPTFTPAPFPQTTPAAKTVYIWASDFVVNSMSFAVFTHGMLQYNLTRPIGKCQR